MKFDVFSFVVLASSLFAADNSGDRLMPLNAFGVTRNATVPLIPENRINPDQHPQTNQLRTYQTKAITNTGYTPTLTYTTPFNRCTARLGPYFGNTGLTGPGFVLSANVTPAFTGDCITEAGYSTGNAAQINLANSSFAGYNIPSLAENPASYIVIFNAAEFDATAPEGFTVDNISTSLDPHGMSLQTVYRHDYGSITDYVVMGNSFHDVFYDGLTPRILMDTPFDLSGGFWLDGVNTPIVAGGMTGSGTSFRFALATGGPTIHVIFYAENDTATTLNFTVQGDALASIQLTGDASYTGWLRAAFIQPAAMDLNTASLPPCVPDTGQPVTVPGTDPAVMTNVILAPNWFTQLEVQAIASIPVGYYTLYPHDWITRVNLQQLLQQNTTSGAATVQWPGNLNGIRRLSANAPSTALILPLLTFDDGSVVTGVNPTLFDQASTILGGSAPLYGLTIFGAGYGGALPTPPAPYGDSSASLFTTAFSMGFTHGQATTISSFQDGALFPSGEALPVHAESNGSIATMVAILDSYRSAIPTSVSNVTYSGNEITIDYAMASNTSGTSQTTAPLIAFPAWMETENGTLEDYVFNSGIKGNLFTVGATGGTITFGERDWSTGVSGDWIESGDFLPPGTLSSIFGADTPASTVLTWLDDIYTDQQFPWIGGTPTSWPSQPPTDGMAQPLFTDATTLTDGYGTGKVLFQIANTATLMAEFLDDKGESSATIVTATQPLIDYVKRRLFDFFLNRPIVQNYFVPDSTNHGVCFNGNPTPNSSAATLATVLPVTGLIGNEQQSGIQQQDFGNYLYNDHVLQYGYYMQAVARIIAWDRTYTASSADRFINQRVTGADHNTYAMRQVVDMLWRDALNPFVETDGFPYLRCFNLWEGHPEAQGTIYPAPGGGVNIAFSSGRNMESIAESYNTLTGTFYYATQLLGEGTPQDPFYTDLKDAMLLLMKFTTSAANVLWYMKGSGYATSGGGAEVPAFFNGYYLNYTLTSGNVNDSGMDGQVAFSAGPQTPPQ